MADVPSWKENSNTDSNEQLLPGFQVCWVQIWPLFWAISVPKDGFGHSLTRLMMVSVISFLKTAKFLVESV